MQIIQIYETHPCSKKLETNSGKVSYEKWIIMEADRLAMAGREVDIRRDRALYNDEYIPTISLWANKICLQSGCRADVVHSHHIHWCPNCFLKNNETR